MPPRIAARSRAGASAFRAQAMRNLESICQAGYSGSLHSWVEQDPNFGNFSQTVFVTFASNSVSSAHCQNPLLSA